MKFNLRRQKKPRRWNWKRFDFELEMGLAGMEWGEAGDEKNVTDV